MRSALRLIAVLALATLVGCHGSHSPSAPQPEFCGNYPDWKTSPFVLPYPVGTAYRVAQGNCSTGGHQGVYRYSYDFNMSIGTPVTAARDGVVYQIRTGYANGDLTPGHENFVKIQHSDGLISAYSHLSKVLVETGDLVHAGDRVGSSGNTGNTGGLPHLHFHVSTCSEPVNCGTVATTFRNTDPNPEGLQVGHIYPANPY